MSAECNCLRSQGVDCMSADRADECSRLPAGAVVNAPLSFAVDNAATVPPLQSRAVQCSAVSQADSQSDTHTGLSATDSLRAPLDLGLSSGQPSPKLISGSMLCGYTQPPTAPTAPSPQPNTEPLGNVWRDKYTKVTY